MKNKFLVTTALPYANGPIHLGHVLEGIQADIWVRYQKAVGNECYFFCADDTHGTPVMIAARKENTTPEELVKKIHSEHYKDLTGFHIRYDNYYSTDSPENQSFSEEIYLNNKKEGHISEREIEQSYCEHDKMFLPDRFIKGICPKCKAQGQYGDGCESCGSSYSPKDLIDSECSLCGKAPVLKTSRHLFFRLQDFNTQLLDWMSRENHLHEGARKKLMEWFNLGLQEWDISRDAPYFGFKIPGEEDKYFYVWLDAPIGYMASSKNYFSKKEAIFLDFWKNGNGKVIHFIGKDILYFHALFWPAMLMGAGYKPPSQVNVHGFMTVNGEKMSKSRGTFIEASRYLKYLDPEHFRFYLAGRLGPGLEDLDLNFEDFTARVNSDLVGNLVNIFSRSGTSLLDKLGRKTGSLSPDGVAVINKLLESADDIKKSYNERCYSRVLKTIAGLGDIVNRYVNDNQPWVLVKKDPERAREVITASLNCGYILAIYLSPVLPEMSKKIFRMLDVSESSGFNDLMRTVEKKPIREYEVLSSRVDEKQIEKMIEEGKSAKGAIKMEKEKVKEESGSGFITIQDLAKVELRVGKILEALPVEGADKLLQLKVDLGESGIKNVFAGIKAAYKAEDLTGLKVVVVANLEPRKMKFGTSDAMILASGSGDQLSIFIPHRDANPGDLLK